jgi:hypothetical protein
VETETHPPGRDELSFVHPKVVSQFVENGLADLMADFCFIPAERLDIFLVENDAARSRAKVEHALLSSRHTLENAQNQTTGLAGADLALQVHAVFPASLAGP